LSLPQCFGVQSICRHLWRQGWPKGARVCRGGSFNNNRNNVRCAYRNDNDPDNRNNNIGFRVAASHSLHSHARSRGLCPVVTGARNALRSRT